MQDKGVQFKYKPLKFIIGGGRSDALISKDLRIEPEIKLGAVPISPAGEELFNQDAAEDQAALEQEAEDFLAFDEPVEDIIEVDATALEQSKPLDALLHDYIALDILEDVKKSAKKQEAIRPSRPELLQEVPWLASLTGMQSPLVRLHHEIVEFCRYVQPSPEEDQLRKAAIQRVSDVVTSIWPSASVAVFGSFATGLHLPTSDVDLVVLESGCKDIPSGLKALATSLARKNISKDMQVIAKAKVPIVKFMEAESGYNFDISFDVANGPEAAQSVNELMQALPPMRHLVMVLKVFLQQRELNEVYSGGLGSYALLVLVAAFLQMHPSRHRQVIGKQERPKKRAKKSKQGDETNEGKSASINDGKDALEPNLGMLLLDFLRLYGRALRHTHVGVSCRKGGAFFRKQSRGFHQEERPYMLAVEDPNDPTNDLGRNSFNISKVRMAFDFAYCQLIAPTQPGESLLKRVIRLEPVLFVRAPPAPTTDNQPIESPKAVDNNSIINLVDEPSNVAKTKQSNVTKETHQGGGKKKASVEPSKSLVSEPGRRGDLDAGGEQNRKQQQKGPGKSSKKEKRSFNNSSRDIGPNKGPNQKKANNKKRQGKAPQQVKGGVEKRQDKGKNSNKPMNKHIRFN